MDSVAQFWYFETYTEWKIEQHYYCSTYIDKFSSNRPTRVKGMFNV